MRIPFLPLFLLILSPLWGIATTAQNNTAIEALSRLKGLDLDASPALKGAVLKILATTRGTPQFVDIVRDFKLADQGVGLLECAVLHPTHSSGAEAMRLLAAQGQIPLITAALTGTNAAIVLTVLGNTGEKQFVPLIKPFITDPQRGIDLKKVALHSLTQTPEGTRHLLEMVRSDQLSADLKPTAMTVLNQVRWSDLKAEAAKLLPVPQVQDAQPLPPIADLLKQTGNPTRGALVFQRAEVGCSLCHQVDGKGMDFGPKLSEIGTKLGKDALYQSILEPSAGISFGFEAWQLDLKNGDEAYGIISSETAEDVALKTQNGIVTKYEKSNIAHRQQMTSSIMPSGLEHTMSPQDLVDLIEYLMTLKKKG